MSYIPRFLGHVNVYVRNAERAQKWYEDLLGLHTYDFVPKVAAFMSADLDNSHELALMEVAEEAPTQLQGQVGLNHMAWSMDSLEDLKELYQRIKDRNIPIDNVSDHGISLGIYFRDPDGNGIEVYYEVPRSEWHRQDHILSGEGRRKGRFPGPWDELTASYPPASRNL